MLNALQISKKNDTLSTFPSSNQRNFEDSGSIAVQLLRRISCHGRNYSQPYFFKRNQSSGNRSHGFGANFYQRNFEDSGSIAVQLLKADFLSWQKPLAS